MFLYSAKVRVYVDFSTKEKQWTKEISFEKIPIKSIEYSNRLAQNGERVISSYILENGEEVSIFSVSYKSPYEDANEYIHVSNGIEKDGYIGELYFTEERVNFHGGLEKIKELILHNLTEQGYIRELTSYEYFVYSVLRIDPLDPVKYLALSVPVVHLLKETKNIITSRNFEDIQCDSPLLDFIAAKQLLDCKLNVQEIPQNGSIVFSKLSKPEIPLEEATTSLLNDVDKYYVDQLSAIERQYNVFQHLKEKINNTSA